MVTFYVSCLWQMAKYLRTQSLVTVQCMLVGAIPDKEWEVTFQGLIKKLGETPSSLSRWVLVVLYVRGWLAACLVLLRCWMDAQVATLQILSRSRC
jgi:hypothetical protein